MGIGEVVCSYYNDLFSTSGPLDFHEVIDAMDSEIPTDVAEPLTRPITNSEVWEALFFQRF